MKKAKGQARSSDEYESEDEIEPDAVRALLLGTPFRLID